MKRMRISYVHISGMEMSLGTRDTLDPEGLRIETDVHARPEKTASSPWLITQHDMFFPSRAFMMCTMLRT
jgi:hypothetical protein